MYMGILKLQSTQVKLKAGYLSPMNRTTESSQMVLYDFQLNDLPLKPRKTTKYHKWGH